MFSPLYEDFRPGGFPGPLRGKTIRKSRRRKSRSVPEGGADFPEAIFLAGKCPNLGRDSIFVLQENSEIIFQQLEICKKALPARNFGQPQPS